MLRTSIIIAAAATAAVTALAACGPVHMGAAAVAGGQTISASTLSTQVANEKDAYKARQGQVQLQFPRSQFPQAVLSWLVRFRVRDQLAARNRVVVTAAQSQQALNATAAQIRASGGNLTDVAVANGLPPEMLPQLGRYLAIQSVLVRRMAGGKLPTSQNAQTALSKEFSRSECLAAKSLDISVNPQYGRLDYATMSVATAPPTLSAPQGGAATPSPAPQLTPAC